MTNAIKFILQQRNMREKELQAGGKSKQAISKWVLRQRKINEDIILAWERSLGVPKRFFVDDDGYCKELTDNELYELECYLIEQSYENAPMFLTEAERAERILFVDSRVRKLQKRIKADIYESENTMISMEEHLDETEEKLTIYEKLFQLLSSKKLTSDEWNSVLKALSYFKTEGDGDMPENTSLSYQIYSAIKSFRCKKEEQLKENLTLYKELYGEYTEDQSAE